MTVNPRLGLLLRVATVPEALAGAALMGATVIRHHSELQPGQRHLVDLDLTDQDASKEIGERFRMMGAELIVTARPASPVPFSLRRNLTGLSGGTAA